MDEAKDVVQVAEEKAPPLDQLVNLQSQVSRQDEKFTELDEELPVLRQHLKDAAETLHQAIVAFKDVETRVNAIVQVTLNLESKTETLERKCQSLSDRPMIRSCPSCTAKLDARAQQCPKCSTPTPY